MPGRSRAGCARTASAPCPRRRRRDTLGPSPTCPPSSSGEPLMTPEQAAQVSSTVLSSGKAVTFLILTLGPLKIIGPFARMTRGRDARFKRSLALQGTAVAIVATLMAGIVGSAILEKWGVSLGALLLAAGAVLFLVALRPLLEQFHP